MKVEILFPEVGNLCGDLMNIRYLHQCCPELEVLETRRFGLPEYRFAWASASDEGNYVSQASLVEDGSYYYALIFSVREEMGSAYEGCAEAVFSSFGLYGDEMS